MNNSSDRHSYTDRKYCDQCDDYASYLMSVETSYCVRCGAQVHLFSEPDWESFNQSLQDRRPKGGRPSKRKKGKESA